MKQSFWFGIAISLGLLVLVFQQADVAHIGQTLAGADYPMLAFGIAVYFLTLFIRAARWQQLLAPVRPIAFWPLCSAEAIGLMGNTLLPARSGEFLRGFILGRRAQLPFSTSLATIVVERLLDGVTFLLLVGVVLLAFPASPEWLRMGGYIAAPFYVGLLGFLGILAVRPASTLRVTRAVLRILPARLGRLIDRWLTAFVDGLSSLRDRRCLAVAGLYSVALWAVFGLITYIAARALHLDLSLLAAFVVLVAIAIAVTVPSAPGFVGTTQFFCVLGLGLFGVGADDALSFSIIYQAAYSLPIALIGLACLSIEGLSLGDVRRAFQSMAPSAAPPEGYQ